MAALVFTRPEPRQALVFIGYLQLLGGLCGSLERSTPRDRRSWSLLSGYYQIPPQPSGMVERGLWVLFCVQVYNL